MITGDQSRRQVWDSCQAQLALRDAVASNPVAAAALPQLDKVDAVASQSQAAFSQDCQVLSQADSLPKGTPDSLVALAESLRAHRMSASGLS